VKKSLQLKGVKKVDMDFEKGLFTLQVDGKTGIKPSDVRTAVKKKYKVESVVVEGLAGEARKDGDKVLFKAKGSGLEFLLLKEKDGKAFDELCAKLGEGKTQFTLGGAAAEEKDKDKDGKEMDVLKLTVASAAVIESK
jgi:hypothetical protein